MRTTNLGKTKPTEPEVQKIKRYERIIEKLKKTLEVDRRFLGDSRKMYQIEISSKTELEHMLRECVE